MKRTPVRRPLEGVLVVSIDQAVAAPFAASRLADAGARVIKVERPGGDFARGYDTIANGESSYFVWLNRGKESIELDFRKPGDAALLRNMIDQADVFVQNLAPGAAERAGLRPDELRKTNPQLITCSITGYGSDGPFANKKAYDLLIQAESGLASITGTHHAPGRVGLSIVDIAAGMYAYTGILEALITRRLTGRGAELEVSLFDAIADWMTVPYLHQVMTGRAPARVGIAHPSICPYGAFDTADRRPIIFAVQNEREWHRLCHDVLERSDLAEDLRFASNAKRCTHREEVNAAVAPVCASYNFSEIAERLDKAQVAHGALNTVEGFANHPHLRTTEVMTPVGSVRYPAPPVRNLAHAEPRLGASPKLGEHGDRLRREFGATEQSRSPKRAI